MHILVLASTENPGLYETAARLAQMGCNVTYYFDGADSPDSVIDKNDIVHVSTWRGHAREAHLILTNDCELLYACERMGSKTPIMYQANSINRNIYLSPMARDEAAEPLKRPWWKLWSRNG